MERGTVRVSVLPKNTTQCPRLGEKTWTVSSRIQRANHEANAPLHQQPCDSRAPIWWFCFVFITCLLATVPTIERNLIKSCTFMLLQMLYTTQMRVNSYRKNAANRWSCLNNNTYSRLLCILLPMMCSCTTQKTRLRKNTRWRAVKNITTTFFLHTEKRFD